MKIISIRKGFTADHSSTSYEFLAIDRPLTEKEQDEVARLSKRAEPTERHVSFIYHVDGYDLPGGWEPLIERYYDLMVSESYGLWIFALAFSAPPEQHAEISRYAFDGIEDLGVRVSTREDRIVVSLYCNIDDGALYELSTVPGRKRRGGGDPTQALFHLLTAIRQQLIAGDYRALYALWEEYGYVEEEEEEELSEMEEGEEGEEYEQPAIPPEPPAQATGQEIIEQFRGLLTSNY